MADDLLPPGAAREEELPTKPGMGVTHAGPVEMLSTPAMIGLMEGVALRLMQEHLEEGLTSVGARVDVRHLAPHRRRRPRACEGFVQQDGGAAAHLRRRGMGWGREAWGGHP